MLRRLFSIVCVVAISVAMVGCAPETTMKVADQAKDGVDASTDAAKGVAETVVPESSQGSVDDAIDTAGEGTKDAIDAASGQ